MKYSGGRFITQSSYFFEVSGDLILPVETAIGPLIYNHNEFEIKKAVAIVRTKGTAQYTVKVVSYDSNGSNAVTHINQSVSFTNDKGIVDLTISTATISKTRTVEVTLTQQTGTHSSDFSLSLV